MTSTQSPSTADRRSLLLARAARVLLVWALATLTSFLMLRLGAQDTPATPWGGPSPSWVEHMAFWDAGWYERVLTEGYPTTLPQAQGGRVEPNAWAFMPLLPYLSLPLTSLGLPFPAAGALVSLAASAGAALVLDHWLAPRTTPSASLWAVALVWTSPCAPVLQVPYAESLGLALVGAALCAASRGRYLWAAPLVVLAAFARPVGVPLAAALGLWWLWRLSAYSHLPWPRPLSALPARARLLVPAPHSARDQAVPGLRDHLGLLGLSLLSGVAALSWPALAALVTGRADAYTATETAWRGTSLTPFVPWLVRSGYFVGEHLGPLLLVAVLGLVALALSSRPLRGLGPAVWWWCVAYCLYLLVFFDPTTSLLRLLLPLAPAAWAVVTAARGRATRLALVLAGVVGQLFWVSWVWDLGSVSIQWVP